MLHTTFAADIFCCCCCCCYSSKFDSDFLGHTCFAWVARSRIVQYTWSEIGLKWNELARSTSCRKLCFRSSNLCICHSFWFCHCRCLLFVVVRFLLVNGATTVPVFGFIFMRLFQFCVYSFCLRVELLFNTHTAAYICIFCLVREFGWPVWINDRIVVLSYCLIYIFIRSPFRWVLSSSPLRSYMNMQHMFIAHSVSTYSITTYV